MKSIAIRLDDEMHAQLSIVAQLSDSSITEEIRQAIEAHLAAKREAPELTAMADEALEAIERDASSRRDAIKALFQAEAKPATSGTRSRKRTSESSGD